MGTQTLSPNFSTRVCKKTLDQAGKDINTLNSKTFTDMSPNHNEFSSVPLKYTIAIYTGMPKKTLVTTLLILEKYIFICSCIYHFLLFFFSINNDHIQKCFLKSLRLLLLVSLLFLEIMKVLVLVEHLSRTGI